MTRGESLQIVSMLMSGWPQGKELVKEEIDMYARGIQDLDVELTTHAVLKAVKDAKYRPTVAELRERVWMEKRRLAAEVAPRPDPVGSPLPLWVKRWICARMLYKSFGKEKDYRRFPEQGDFGDLTIEVMPEGAWVEEAESFDDEEMIKRWTQAINSR